MVEKKSPGPNMNAFGDNEVATTWPDDPTARRKVLIATLECASSLFLCHIHGSQGLFLVFT